MIRGTDSTLLSRFNDVRRSTSSAAATLASPDARWVLVSTSVTPMVAGAVAWLAAGAMPPGLSRDTSRDRALMPYELFVQLAKGGDATYAAIAPSFTSGQNIEKRGTSVDAALTAEDDNASSGIETHTITLEPGDTLMGALTDAGISATEAQAVITALSKAYDPRAIHAGQSFDLTFAAPTTA